MLNKNGFKKLLIAIIILLFGSGLTASGYFLSNIQERQDRNTEEKYIQMGDIRALNVQLKGISETMIEIKGQLQVLDSLRMAVNSMDTKLQYLVDGY